MFLVSKFKASKLEFLSVMRIKYNKCPSCIELSVCKWHGTHFSSAYGLHHWYGIPGDHWYSVAAIFPICSRLHTPHLVTFRQLKWMLCSIVIPAELMPIKENNKYEQYLTLYNFKKTKQNAWYKILKRVMM